VHMRVRFRCEVFRKVLVGVHGCRAHAGADADKGTTR
jgi:hypothetical protein